jgi:chromosome condensin MukBEF ATPase and DNA-binding subunit MukB
MFNNTGLGGALMISQQLEMYRWEDHFRRMRENNALAATDVAWRNQYNDLVNRYNALLRDANRLADVQDRGLNIQGQHIKDLEATNANLEARIKELTLDLADAKSKVRFLRGSLRELRPGTYQSIYEDE